MSLDLNDGVPSERRGSVDRRQDDDPVARRLRFLKSRGSLHDTFPDIDRPVRAAVGTGDLLVYRPRIGLKTQGPAEALGWDAP